MIKKFDGHDFHYEKGMPQIDRGNMRDDSPTFGVKSEIFLTEFIANSISENCNFADIGAHFGQIGMIAAKRTKGNVYCFEPILDIYKVLEKNCKVLPNMIPYNVGLYNENKKLPFTRSSMKYGGANKINELSGDLYIDCRKLDDYDLHIDIMNIDVEGAADKVIEGAEKTLKNTTLIFLEKHSGESFEKLEEYGFECVYQVLNHYIYKKRDEKNGSYSRTCEL